MNRTVFLLFSFLLGAYAAAAQQQQLKLGVSAGFVRSFVYPQGFSTKGRYDYVHAEGQPGYMAGLQVEKPLAPKLAYNFSARFLSTSTYYDVDLLVPEVFGITHLWRAKRRSYRFYNGASYTLLERGSKKWRIFGGLLAGVETQQLQADRVDFSFYDVRARTIILDFDYTDSRKPVWLIGAELGLGVRLYNGVDLNLSYNHNFTRTADIRYTSTIRYDGAPGSPRASTGTIKGRPNFAAAELVVWFK